MYRNKAWCYIAAILFEETTWKCYLQFSWCYDKCVINRSYFDIFEISISIFLYFWMTGFFVKQMKIRNPISSTTQQFWSMSLTLKANYKYFFVHSTISHWEFGKKLLSKTILKTNICFECNHHKAINGKKEIIKVWKWDKNTPFSGKLF